MKRADRKEETLELNPAQRYIIDEHIEDYRDGLISRRELVRRVTLIAGSATAAATILAACDTTPARPTTSTPSKAGSSATTAIPSPAAYATPPASPTTDGVTVKENDPGSSCRGPRSRARTART